MEHPATSKRRIPRSRVDSVANFMLDISFTDVNSDLPWFGALICTGIATALSTTWLGAAGSISGLCQPASCTIYTTEG